MTDQNSAQPLVMMLLKLRHNTEQPNVSQDMIVIFILPRSIQKEDEIFAFLALFWLYPRSISIDK